MFTKIAVKVLIFIAVVIGGLLIYASFQPKDYFITREIKIKASAEKIFSWINNSKKANEWMPWVELDPQVIMSYSGPDEGVGSVSSWVSEGQMGTGSAEVMESVSNQVVKTRLIYTKPFETTQFAEVSITPEDEQSKVTWSVKGENNLIGRFFCIFMNMDKMVGGLFDKGLAKLKTKVEATN